VCYPRVRAKKFFVYASRFSQHLGDAPGFGWEAHNVRFNWRTLLASKNTEIARLEGLYRLGLEKAWSTTGRHFSIGKSARLSRLPAQGTMLRALAKTEAFKQSSRDRKRVEMHCLRT
jgi:hypothetical protein